MSAVVKIKRAGVLCALVLAALCLFAPAVFAEDDPVAADGFGISAFDGEVTAGPLPNPAPNPGEPLDPANFAPPYTQAGGHPYEASTTFRFNRFTNPFYEGAPDGENWPEEPVKDTVVELPPGLIGNVAAFPTCTLSQLMGDSGRIACPAASQVGMISVVSNSVGGADAFLTNRPVVVMPHPPDSPARFGANLFGTLVTVEAELRSDGDYGISLVSRDISEGITINQIRFTFWGVPADPRHDPWRYCPGSNYLERGCASDGAAVPFITLPTACTAPGEGLTTTLHADSWFHPGDFDEAAFESHLAPGFRAVDWLNPESPDSLQPALPPALPESQWGAPQGPTGCDELLFEPKIAAAPSTDASETPSGLSVDVSVPDEGLADPDFLSQSNVKKAVVSLPEGVTINPAAAEGLGYCTPSQLDRETFNSTLGEGCPAESRIGSVQIESPLIEHKLEGSLFISQQDDPATSAPGAENPFDSLLAIYLVAKGPEDGIVIKLAGRVTPNPKTGQLQTTFGDPSAAEPTFRQLPQLPFSNFHLKFREGQRGILVTPPACGTYQTKAEFTPYSDPSKVKTVTSPFTVSRGVGGGPCPTGATRGFHPGLDAGTLNNAAGRYSPFNLRLTRSDGEQEFTHFSIKLPPGLTAKLAGVPFCPDAAIAAAKAPERTGAQELASPSCPASSEVGRTLVGAGVGPALSYVPGKVYLAGPYNGSALSIAAITAARVGPFDVGTVVVRVALKVNPETAEVFIDATGSDPIPHIIDGIVVHARDIRVYVDRPEFTLNPTDCTKTSTASTLLGSGADFVSEIDDNPITVTSPFQAADCGALGFKPKLSLSLSGGTKRGDNPKFKAVLNARPGDANIGSAQVTLPHSEFLDNEHIKTICTRAQFKEGTVPGEKCPAASIYGYAKAVTPLLDEPLEGPVFLRSSSHNLPDLLVALHSGKIDVNLAGRIDSVQGGRIRNSFEAVPDAPVTRFILTMQGGKKGLLVNSTNLCKSTNRAIVAFTGQNGKRHNFDPVLKAQCKKAKKAKKKRG
jgi:hypothetical protein